MFYSYFRVGPSVPPSGADEDVSHLKKFVAVGNITWYILLYIECLHDYNPEYDNDLCFHVKYRCRCHTSVCHQICQDLEDLGVYLAKLVRSTEIDLDYPIEVIFATHPSDDADDSILYRNPLVGKRLLVCGVQKDRV